MPPNRACSKEAVSLELKKHPAQCMLCGIYLHFPYLTNDLALKRHESSGMHQAALSVAEASMKASPARCNGLILTEEPGKNTLMGTKVQHQDCVKNADSRTSTSLNCCNLCKMVAEKRKYMELIETWAERSFWIDLVHATLQGNACSQLQIASKMVSLFPILDKNELEKISYSDALRHCKNFFLNVPRKSMCPALLRFLELNLNYLTPGVVLGIGTGGAGPATSRSDYAVAGPRSLGQE